MNPLAVDVLGLDEVAEHGVRGTATIVKLELSNHGGCKYEYQVNGHNYTKSETRCGTEPQIGTCSASRIFRRSLLCLQQAPPSASCATG